MSLINMNQHSSIFSNTIAENNNDSSEASAFDENFNNKGYDSDEIYYPSSYTSSTELKQAQNIYQRNKLKIIT